MLGNRMRGMFSAVLIATSGGKYRYHRTTYLVLLPFPICRTLRSILNSWLQLPLERALCVCLSRFSSFGVVDGGVWSVGEFLGMAGACSSRSMEMVFSVSCLSTVMVFGCKVMMQNGPVLGGESLWYAPVPSRSAYWSLVATSGGREGRYFHPGCKFAFFVHGGHNLVCSAVATFSLWHLYLRVKYVWALLRVHKELEVMCRPGRWTESCHWTAGRSVLLSAI